MSTRRVPGFDRIYGWQLERGLTVAQAEIDLERLPPAGHGLSILLLCDFHVGPFLSSAALELALERLNPLEPDLILLGGDLMTTRLEELTSIASALAALRAPLGRFAVLGNHEHYSRRLEPLVGALEGMAIRVLNNRAALLGDRDPVLLLAGIDDLGTGEPDLDAALAGRVDGLPVVLMSHNPDILFEAAGRGVDLVLSGHTHGGQCRIPGLPVLVRMSRYYLDDGRYRFGSTELVVSRGLGVTGLPMRIACPPEAVLITLRSGAGACTNGWVARPPPTAGPRPPTGGMTGSARRGRV